MKLGSFKKINTLIISLLFTACSSIIRDPEPLGEIPCLPADYWTSADPYINPSLEASDETIFFQSQEKQSLAQLVDVGLSNNPITKFTWSNAKSNAYTYKSTLSLWFPQVDFQENASFIDQSSTLRDPIPPTPHSTGLSTNLFFSDVSIQYLLLDFGGRFGTIESAWQGLVSANMVHNQSIQDVTVLIVTNYYLYLQNLALLEARKEDLKNAQETYDSAKAQFDSGIVTIVDVLQAESNLASTVLAFQQQENLAINSHAALATSIGLPPDTKFEVEETPYEIPKEQIKTEVEFLLSVAKKERADLAARQAQFMQQRANLQVVKSSAMPNITASADYINTQYTQGPIKSGHSYITTISLNIPLFQGFFFTNQIRRAKADVTTAFENWRITEQQIMLDVFTNYYNFQTAVDSLNAADEFLKFSQEAYDALLAQYQSGITTITALLQGEATLANARSQQIESRTAVATTFAQLTYSMGILSVTDDYSVLYPAKKGDEDCKN